MQTNAYPVRKRPLRMPSSSHVRCLLCYVLCFAVPVLWQVIALEWIYPWKLAATAPDAARHLSQAIPALSPLLPKAAEGSLQEMLLHREQTWHRMLWIVQLAAWGLSLLLQLGWRVSHRDPLLASRALRRAILSYRLTTLIIIAVNAAAAWCVWEYGVSHVPGRTMWDWLVCFGAYPLHPLACICVSRLAASPVISGRHAFFKRL